MSDLVLSADGQDASIEAAKRFCADFLRTGGPKKYIFGRNVYAQKVVEQVALDGVVDDFCEDAQYLGLPIIRSGDLPEGAMVLALSGGRPLTVKDQLTRQGIWNLDYFAFAKWSGLALADIVFNEGFVRDLELHRGRYEQVLNLLEDEESRTTFRKLVSFRLKGDVELLRGFTHREHLQYFEDFLGLSKDGEVFYDVGGFDGYTSLEFARHCPGYAGIHIFEPEPDNFVKSSKALSAHRDVVLHKAGLSSEARQLSFTPSGSGSRVSDLGSVEISVVRLDDLDNLQAPTFLKMDIEGAEFPAIRGAEQTIRRARPKMAIAIYHYAGGMAPFWQIPELVMPMIGECKVYVRHYTESIYETVMFFVPR